MGHKRVLSGHPKSTGILRVDGLSTGPPDWGCHTTYFVVDRKLLPVHSSLPLECSSFAQALHWIKMNKVLWFHV